MLWGGPVSFFGLGMPWAGIRTLHKCAGRHGLALRWQGDAGLAPSPAPGAEPQEVLSPSLPHTSAAGWVPLDPGLPLLSHLQTEPLAAPSAKSAQTL